MDDELKQFLVAIEERLSARVQKLEARLSVRLQELEARLNARIDHAVAACETRLEDRIRDAETNLLTEFHKWASPQEVRVRSHTSAINAVDAELEYLKDRVKKLEERHPPTQ
jgi:hypothetical protein